MSFCPPEIVEQTNPLDPKFDFVYQRRAYGASSTSKWLSAPKATVQAPNQIRALQRLVDQQHRLMWEIRIISAGPHVAPLVPPEEDSSMSLCPGLNLLPRSGFINQVNPRWSFYPSTGPGLVTADDRAPEPGMPLVITVPGTANYGRSMHLPPGLLEAGVEYYFSAVVRPGTRNHVFFRTNADSGENSARSYFDLAAGCIGTIAAAHSRPAMHRLGNGLWRVGIAFTPTQVTTQPNTTLHVNVAALDGQNAFASTLGEVLMTHYHAQLERGNTMTAAGVTFPAPA